MKNDNFCSSSRKAKISTTGIYVIFRGLKFEPDAEIGEKVPFYKGLRRYLVTIALTTLGLLCALSGIIGCILPVIPGPALSFVSLIILSYAKNWQVFSTAFLVTMGIFTILLSILDYAIPVFGAKKFGASKFGIWGSIIGMLVGFIFFPPFGIFIGAFFGALAGELFAGKNSKKALRAGWGSFIGNIAAIGVKLAFAGVVLFFYIKAIF